MCKALSLTARYMLVSVAALYVLFAALGAVVILFVYPLEPLSNYLLGLLLGCVATAIRTVMMDLAIQKEVGMPPEKAKNYHQLMFFLRYGVLIAFAVTLIVFSNIFGVYGGVCGILCMQLSAYAANWLLGRWERRHPNRHIPVPAPKTAPETAENPPPDEREPELPAWLERKLYDQEQEDEK